MQRTIAIGNISHDRIHHPHREVVHQLGGAALHLALAAAHAGLPTAPATLIGDDLAYLPDDPRLSALDWTLLRHLPGTRSAAFTIHYDPTDTVTSVTAQYGAAEHLTAHALHQVTHHPRAVFHLSCRHPLDVPALLDALTQQSSTFSLDFHLPSAPQLIPAAAPWLHQAAAIFVNTEEHELLTHTTGAHPCPEVVVTDGPRPAYVLVHGRPLHPVTPPATAVRQITGAGDTLAGTYLAHRAQGTDPVRALQHAVHAATHYTAQEPLILPAPRRPPS